jgi:O-antigen/teichoic acid export membrane protein
VRRLVRATALLGAGSAATVVATIIRAKVLATWLGPQGTGVIAQLATLTAVLVPLATLGIGNGVVTLLAEARAAGDPARVARVQSTALAIALLLGGTLAAACALASPWLAGWIYRDPALAWVVLAGAATVPLSARSSLRVSMLQGHEAVKAMAQLNAVVAVATVATVVPMAWFFGLRGAVVQLVVIAAIYAWWAGRLVKPLAPPRPAGTPRLDRSLLRPLARFGVSSLLVGLSSTLTLLILRSVLIGKLGLGPNGIYQVCVGISGLYMPLVLNSVTATVWPRIAAEPSDAAAAATMREALRLVFLLVTGACAAMLAGAPLWVPLFYSKQFLPALDLLPLQFLGDYFRAAAWMFGIWLVPRNRLRPWVLFDVVYGVVLLVVFVLLVDRIGVRSVVVAYVAAHMSHAALHYALARRTLGFRVGPENRRLLLASLALLLGLLVWTPRTVLGTAAAGAAVLAWLLLAVRPREWKTLRDLAVARLARGMGGGR